MAAMLRRVAPAVLVGTAAVVVVTTAGGSSGLTGSAAAQTNQPATTTPNTGASTSDGSASGSSGSSGSAGSTASGSGSSGSTTKQPSGSGTTGSGGSSSSGSTSGSSCNASEVTGPTAQTRWGPVQVAAKVSGGRVCAVRVLQSPDGDRKSVMINAQAVPALQQQALSAGSADIAGVSGATYTTEGFVESLQAILDKA